MGRRGTRPLPTVIKLLRNNPGRRPLNAAEPKPEPAAETIEPPAWLEEPAKVEFRRIAPLLVRNGLLSELDVDALTMYCVAWCTWKTASGKIRELGSIIKAPNGFPMASPYIPIANRAFTQMKIMMTEFGLTPSSRSNVSRSTRPLEPTNPLSRFINRKRT